VSLEEFARTLTSREESIERYREGAVPARAIGGRVASRTGREERARFREAYRRFRGFDRPNLLALFATFRPSLPFAREYPEAVQCGPLWPGRRKATGGRRRSHHQWVWYASPSSSSILVGAIDRALAGLRDPPKVAVRSPRPLALPPEGGRWVPLGAEEPGPWAERFRGAELRIVTGSRTLLEALEVGGPFLYHNGVLGTGRGKRRHRPEKVIALVRAWAADGVGRSVAGDLAAFSAGRRVEAVARRAATDPGFARGFPARWRPRAFPPPFDDAGRLIASVARRWAGSPRAAAAFAREIRAQGRRSLGLPAAD
jgi:hypothetical protein